LRKLEKELSESKILTVVYPARQIHNQKKRTFDRQGRKVKENKNET
jgi:hypothetical protein